MLLAQNIDSDIIDNRTNESDFKSYKYRWLVLILFMFAGAMTQIIWVTYGVIVDDREGYSPGWKYNEWELKGIPIRIEIGPKDIAKKSVVLVKRNDGKKIQVKMKTLKKEIPKILDQMQKEAAASGLTQDMLNTIINEQ